MVVVVVVVVVVVLLVAVVVVCVVEVVAMVVVAAAVAVVVAAAAAGVAVVLVAVYQKSFFRLAGPSPLFGHPVVCFFSLCRLIFCRCLFVHVSFLFSGCFALFLLLLSLVQSFCPCSRGLLLSLAPCKKS